MRLTALVLLGALSVFAVGCTAEDTDGTKIPRTASNDHSGTGADKSGTTSDTTGTGTATDTSNVAKPVTPADPPSATAATPAKTVVQAKPIACATDTDSVTESYRLVLQRDPDPGGLQSWVGAIQNGDTRLGVLQKIISSEEFASIHANLTDDEFLSFLYHSFFNREPDAAGRQGWLNALAGGQSRASVAQAFTNSPEFKDANSNKAAACYF